MRLPLDAPPPPCAGKHALFDSRDITDHITAKELCGTCPLATYSACLTILDAVTNTSHSLEGGRPEGTWAGRFVGKKSGERPPSQCGTESGFKRHQRAEEIACDECRNAATDASRKRARRARERGAA